MIDIRETYFQWLCTKIKPTGPRGFENAYGNLLRWLNSRTFQFSIGLDYNRGIDGEELRYSFGKEYRVSPSEIASTLDTLPCSVLEMMIALDRRCVTMKYEYEEDHYGEIFWTMLSNMGLTYMTNDVFDPDIVNMAILRVENHEYDPDGKGGLFRLKHPRADLRRIDIWYQAMWYLSENSNLEVD